MQIYFIVVFILSLFLILSIIPNLITITQSHALMQVAGNIFVEIKPGETKTFNWGLLSEKNQSITVNITAEGIGAEFLSFPENVTVAAVSGQITDVPVNVTIPSNYTGPRELTPSIRATEASEGEVGATIINIAMSKVLCVAIAENNTAGTNQNITDFDIITNGTTGQKGIQITYRHDCTDNDFILTGAAVTTIPT